MMRPRHAQPAQSARTRYLSRRFRPQLEELEPRTLLSATLGMEWQSYLAAPSLDNVTPLVSGTGAGLSPAQLRQAYGFNNIVLGNGVVGNGKGQTIAIVTAYNDPTIMQDLHTFDQAFGLTDPSNFMQISPYGSAGTNAAWSAETSLDVEWAHAMAPGANILLVQANSNSLGDLLGAVNYARSQAGVSVVSMSWGIPEFVAETYLDAYFTSPIGKVSPVSFVAASGDYGSAGTSAWPSVSPDVLGVGGTSLSVSSAGTYLSESGWSGSGGEISMYEKQPAFQNGFLAGSKRGAPDVAYDANPSTGFAIYCSTTYAGMTGWMEVGGTSGGAPAWSALVAIANQGRALEGENSVSNLDSQIYSMPASVFHDITSGSNGAYSAGPGYDLVTGRGTPIANLVVNFLINGNAASSGQISLQVAQSPAIRSAGPSFESPDAGAEGSPAKSSTSDATAILLSGSPSQLDFVPASTHNPATAPAQSFVAPQSRHDGTALRNSDPDTQMSPFAAADTVAPAGDPAPDDSTAGDDDAV